MDTNWIFVQDYIINFELDYGFTPNIIENIFYTKRIPYVSELSQVILF
jgi:hypothetical protein